MLLEASRHVADAAWRRSSACSADCSRSCLMKNTSEAAVGIFVGTWLVIFIF